MEIDAPKPPTSLLSLELRRLMQLRTPSGFPAVEKIIEKFLVDCIAL